MTSLNRALQELDRLLESALGDESPDELAGDGETIERLLLAGRIQRRLDGVVIETAAHVVERDAGERAQRLTTRSGCRDAEDLLERTLRVERRSARRTVSAARAVRREVELTSGARLPSRYPALAQALHDGHLSATGFLACIAPFEAARARLSAMDVAEADLLLARTAAGLDPEVDDADAPESTEPESDESESTEPEPPRPAPTVEDLRLLAERIVALLDTDGAEPADETAQRRRHLTVGRERNGLVPIRGELLPDVASQLQRLLDSVLNPKVDAERYDRSGAASSASEGAGAEPDPQGGGAHSVNFVDSEPNAEAGEGPHPATAELRTAGQKRHDALATILGVAAASGGMPTLGGAAPTLVVSVTAEDFARGTGRATIEGLNASVPMSVARHTACAGGVQRVLFDESGAIVGIGTSARLFNAAQRRAIVLRDRECVIFGCHVRAEWCEIHHVVEHSQEGPTHTSNGVAICWHHHRTLDVSGWQIRMRDGVPEVRGPAWWDPYERWRPVHPPGFAPRAGPPIR